MQLSFYIVDKSSATAVTHYNSQVQTYYSVHDVRTYLVMMQENFLVVVVVFILE